MSTIITLDPNNDKAQSVNQLGTYNYTAKSAGVHTISYAAQVVPVSGLTITMQQNGSTKASTAAPARSTTPTTGVTGAGSGPQTAPVFNQIGQSHTDLSVLMNLAIGDVVSVILASALSHDQQIGDIQGILNIRRGQV